MPAAFVVERDAVLRNMVRSVLTAQGFEIMDAATVAEAYALFELLLNPPIDLLILGHTPAAGEEPPPHRILAEELLSRVPIMRVLVTSDCPYQVVAQENGIPQGGYFLQKPFTGVQLLNTVRNILEPSIQ